MEALSLYREEKVKGQEWEEECRVEQRDVPRPKPHPLLVAMGNITVGSIRMRCGYLVCVCQAEKYVLTVTKKTKAR